MSQFGLNSIPIIDNNAMGGFRAGLDTMRGMDHSNSALKSEDLQRQKMSQDMETTQLKRPLDAVEQALKMREAEMGIREMDDGTVAADRQRKRDMEGANLSSKLNENQMKQLEQKIQGMQAVGQIFGDDVNPGNMAMSWEAAREAGKEYGFDLGEYNEQNAAKFLRMKNQTPMAMKLYAENIKRTEDLKNDLISQGSKHNYDIAKQIQSQGFQAGENKLNRQTQLDVARTYRSDSGGGASDPKSMGAATAKIFAKANRFMESGDPKDAPTEMELQLLENNMARTEAERLMFADPLLKVAIMTRDQDPAAAAKVEAAMPRFMAMTGSGRMVQAIRQKAAGVRGNKAGGTVTPPTAGSTQGAGATGGWGQPRVKGQ